jgi:hypothetical protein
MARGQVVGEVIPPADHHTACIAATISVRTRSIV